MALPRALATPNTSGLPRCGPFFSSAGACYYLQADIDGSGNELVYAYKSSNPSTTAFSSAGVTSSGDVSGTTSIFDVYAWQAGNVLHVVVVSYTTPAMGDTTWYTDYFTFTMDTDSWTVTGGALGAVMNYASDFANIPEGYGRIMIRQQDGDIVVIGPGPPNVDKGTDHADVYLAYYITSWSTPKRASSAELGDEFAMALSQDMDADGYNGKYMVGYNRDDPSLSESLMRWAPVYDGTHIVGTYESASAHYHNLRHTTSPFFIYKDGSTWRGSMTFTETTTPMVSEYTFDPTASPPAETNHDDITGTDNPYASSNVLHVNDPNTDTRYCFYVLPGTPDAIKYVTSENQGTWGGATTFDSPANDVLLPYSRAIVGTSPVDGSSTVIGFLYLDNTAGVGYYDELDITPAGGGGVTREPMLHMGRQTGIEQAARLGGVLH